MGGMNSISDDYDRQEEEVATEEGMPLLPHRDDWNEPIDNDED